MSDIFKRIIDLDRADAYLFTSETNVSYMTGFSGDSSEFLLAGGRGFFFTDARYTQQALKDISEGVEIITTTAQERLGAIKKALAGAGSLAIEKRDVSLDTFELWQRELGVPEYADISQDMLRLRAVKSPVELQKISTAAAGNDVVLEKLVKIIQPGMTERDLKAELIYQINIQGMDCAFPPIVASGENSALPHATVTNRELRDGDMLTLDFGCRYMGYCSDITRTFGIGNVDGRLKSIYDIVCKAQEAAHLAAAREKSAKAVDFAARDLIEKHGYGEYYRHGTGHGVGLQIHELPVLNQHSEDTLLPGMVYTIEPGIYVPGLGGVRIEDMCIAGVGSLYGFSKELILIQ